MILSNYDHIYFNKKELCCRINTNYNYMTGLLHVHMSHKEVISNKKFLGFLLLAMKLITGLSPKGTFAKQSIATFKLKKDMNLGCKSVLNKDFALDFIYKLKSSLLPNRGDLIESIKKNFNVHENYDSGLRDITIFPELNHSFEYFDKNIGMNYGYFQSFKNTHVDLNKYVLSSLELPFLKG